MRIMINTAVTLNHKLPLWHSTGLIDVSLTPRNCRHQIGGIALGYDQRLTELGIVLPEPFKLPAGMVLPFPWINVRGNRAYISGHGAQEVDGSPAGPFGAVGDTVSVEEGYASARKVGLSILASLQRELGSLDRITGWCRVHGMINCARGFTNTPMVLNGFTDLILDVFGPEVGRHARTAVGAAGLPLNFPVEIEAEVIILAR